MSVTEWLRAIAVWSPNVHPYGLEERIPAFVLVLGVDRFPPAVFCEATVKLMAAKCEMFPCYKEMVDVLEGYRP
jgi:hypothetical protein